MAGAMGDPFRAVANMPGVGQLVTGLPVFFVRGAPPGNLGFQVDGVRVPLLFHAFLGPAVIHPKMIERIELKRGFVPEQDRIWAREAPGREGRHRHAHRSCWSLRSIQLRAPGRGDTASR